MATFKGGNFNDTLKGGVQLTRFGAWQVTTC